MTKYKLQVLNHRLTSYKDSMQGIRESSSIAHIIVHACTIEILILEINFKVNLGVT